tara:strand:+ start:217 stop:417 length:201 start_codon:yes stop_codon:yes gene_type:complete
MGPLRDLNETARRASRKEEIKTETLGGPNWNPEKAGKSVLMGPLDGHIGGLNRATKDLHLGASEGP